MSDNPTVDEVIEAAKNNAITGVSHHFPKGEGLFSEDSATREVEEEAIRIERDPARSEGVNFLGYNPNETPKASESDDEDDEDDEEDDEPDEDSEHSAAPGLGL